MKSILALVIGVLAITEVSAQDPVAYKIFDTAGVEVSFETMAATLARQDVVLFGELHNNPIDHWLQLELAKSLAYNRDLKMGAEMFETDDQLVLNEYLEDKIKESHFKKETKVWPNYDTDYRPLVEYAKENGIEFVATNVPRRYASLVSREGIEALSELSKEAKRFLPKVPFDVNDDDKGYELMTEMMGGHGMDMTDLIAAQALKDYTMAASIAKNWSRGELFLHFNGTFHSDYYSGIYNYLKQAKKKLSIGTIASVEADELSWSDDWSGLADFVIVKPSTMTKTH